MVNAAIFFQRYQGLQVFVLENPGFTGVPLPKLINADDAEIIPSADSVSADCENGQTGEQLPQPSRRLGHTRRWD